MRIAQGKHAAAWIVGTNVVLIAGTVTLIALYSVNYQSKIVNQNVEEITNINTSAANVSSALFKNQQKVLIEKKAFVINKGYGLNDALTFLSESDTDSSFVYEVIGTDATGYAAVSDGKGGFVKVTYTSSDYTALQSIFSSTGDPTEDTVLSTPIYTDNYTKWRSFGLYQKVTIENVNYTFVASLTASDYASYLKPIGQYENLKTMLMNADGDCVLSSSEFAGTNLFQYFYTYSSLTKEEREADRVAFTAGKTIFYHLNTKGQQCIFVITKVDGTEWYAVSWVPLSSYRNSGQDMIYTLPIFGLLFALVLFNTLWLMASNRRLKESAGKEKEANSAKTDFLSRMSHDIRTPLNVISGSVLLARREKNPPKTEEALQNIDQSSQFLLSLVNDVLDLNKVGAGKMELHTAPYSLKDLRDGLNGIIAPLAEAKKINFSITGCDSDQPYDLDPVRLKQIFFNILSNSLKFTPDNGHISLVCNVSPKDKDCDNLIFKASDDGAGMSKEFQNHMYEAFSQENRTITANNSGTGLGLAIVFNLVKLMHGNIDLRSDIGEGTVFYITLPAKKTNEAAPIVAEQTTSLDVLKGRRALLFEDNDINAKIATTLL